MKLSSPQRCEIAKYADQHGAAETAQHFSRKLGKCVNESTVKSRKIKKAVVHRGNFCRVYFRRWARATKIICNKNLTKIFLTPYLQ